MRQADDNSTKAPKNDKCPALNTDTVHEKLAKHGKKESFTTGKQRKYHKGYADALEWVLNNAITEGDS